MKTFIIFLFLTAALYAIVQSAYSLYYFRKARILSKKTFTGKQEIKNNKPSLSVYTAGDSIGAGVGASSLKTSVFGRVADYLSVNHSLIFENASVSGIKMADLLSLNPPKDQDLVILIVSSNDVFRFTPQEKFKSDTERVLEKYTKISKKIIIIGPGRVWIATAIPLPLRLIYKINVPQYAQIMTDVSKKYENVVHLTPSDFPSNLQKRKNTLATDKFHPNDQGYADWFEIIKTAL